MCSGFVENIPTAKVPQIPHIKCTAIAPTGSSNFIASINETANTIKAPAIPPIIIALSGVITSAPAVIPTKPPKIPFKNIVKSKFLYLINDTNTATTPPAAAAKQVVTKVNEVNSGFAESTEPPLKPNHPNQRISTPAVAIGILCPGIACAFPFLNFPIRDPKR